MRIAVPGRSTFLPTFSGPFVKAESSPSIFDRISMKIFTLFISFISHHKKVPSKASESWAVNLGQGRFFEEAKERWDLHNQKKVKSR
jgi:hypothetical protein